MDDVPKESVSTLKFACPMGTSTGYTAADAPSVGAGRTSATPEYTAPPVIATDEADEAYRSLALPMAFAMDPCVEAKTVPPEMTIAPQSA